MTGERPCIAILVLPETTGAMLYGLHDLFLSAGQDWGIVTTGEPGPQLIEPLLVARETGPMTVCNGVRVEVHAGLEQCPSGAVICVPEVNLPPGTPLAGRYRPEIDWLKQRYAEGAVLAAGCSGAMLFAEAGLLDGHDATTHWAWCDVMRRRFPKVRVQQQSTLVVSGEGQRLIMAGGGGSFLDLVLYLIARTVGVDIALQVARVNLIDWHEFGQQPYALLTGGRRGDDALIGECQRWIAENHARPNPVGALVRRSGLAERTFKRRFRQATGMSPIDYVHAVRLEEAKHQLESTDLPIEAIAETIGYEDGSYFGRLFKRKVGLTPAQYRRRFGKVRRLIGNAVGPGSDTRAGHAPIRTGSGCSGRAARTPGRPPPR